MTVYSALSFFAGSAVAALITWILTVNNVISSTTMPVARKIHQESSVLYSQYKDADQAEKPDDGDLSARLHPIPPFGSEMPVFHRMYKKRDAIAGDLSGAILDLRPVDIFDHSRYSCRG